MMLQKKLTQHKVEKDTIEKDVSLCVNRDAEKKDALEKDVKKDVSQCVNRGAEKKDALENNIY